MRFFLISIFLIIINFSFGQKRLLYEYDSTMNAYHNFTNGYTDTFSVENSRFRIIINANKTLEIQKLKKDNWSLIDSMPDCYQFTYDICLNQKQVYTSASLNLVPYILYFLDRDQFCCVYLYDDKAETFVKSGFWSFGADSVHKIKGNIYCDMDGGRFSFDNRWTTLYTIKNFKKYDLGITERIPQGYNSSNYDSTVKEEIILIKKINNDTEFVTIDSFKIKDEKDFNELNYWKKNYTKFYPNEKSISNIYPIFLDPYIEVKDYDNIDFKD